MTSEEPRIEPSPPRRIPIDISKIQVLASKEELDRRIAAFIAGKREEINRLNRIEFCRRFEEGEEGSCARVDSILVKKEGSRSHLRTSSVYNTAGGAQVLAGSEGAAVCPPALRYPEPLHNRLQDMETRVFTANPPLPPDLYARMKQLEDRILFLEGASPEYSNSLESLVKIAEKRDRVRREQERRDQLSASLADIDLHIHQLEAKIRQKYSHRPSDGEEIG